MMPANAFSIANRSAGFTLVETLIGLMLASVIFVSAYQVITNLVQYQTRAADASQRDLDELLLKNMFGQIIGKSLHQSDLYYRVEKNPFFIGRSDQMQVISRAYSEHFDEPGYRIYQVDRKGERLNIAYRRYDAKVLDAAPTQIDSGIEVKDLRFSYLGARGWENQWDDKQALPKMIRVSLALPGRSEFEWIVGTGQS